MVGKSVCQKNDSGYGGKFEGFSLILKFKFCSANFDFSDITEKTWEFGDGNRQLEKIEYDLFSGQIGSEKSFFGRNLLKTRL